MFLTSFFQTEVKEVKSMFRENGYPSSFFKKIIKRLLTEEDAKKRPLWTPLISKLPYYNIISGK